MAIKKIQLRGISRSPSDRMTADGGCAESLNVCLDSEEIAPVLEPKDKTKELGIDSGKLATMGVSIENAATLGYTHKTANYEHYIFVEGRSVYASTPAGLTVIMSLGTGTSVTDIASVGNTLILSTTDSVFYFIYKERRYATLGTKVPFPHIQFYSEKAEDGTALVVYPEKDTMAGCASEEEWNNESFNREEKLALIDDVWGKLDGRVSENLNKHLFTFPRMVRYAVELYDGTKLSSMPLIVGADKYEAGATLQLQKYFVPGYASQRTAKIQSSGPYTISAKLLDKEVFKDWLDIVKSIKIYVSADFYSAIDRGSIPKSEQWQELPVNETDQGGESYYGTDTTNYINLFSYAGGFDEILTATAPCFLLKEIEITESSNKVSMSNEIDGLMRGITLKAEGDAFPEKMLEDGTIHVENNLYTQEQLKNDDMQHYELGAERMSTFNNRLILLGTERTMLYDYSNLNFYVKSSGAKSATYEVAYILEGINENKVVRSEPISVPEGYAQLAFLVFPDTRCKKAIVKSTINGEIRYRSYDMVAHPALPCSYSVYFSAGAFKDVHMGGNLHSGIFPTASPKDDTENKLYISDMDNPFAFLPRNAYSMQGRPIGAAVANTALSQGQFGQFPLYVFTEEGIWAMETSSDGSFVSAKPLSRDVCISPDSIASIDQAVVFVTEKGLMLLSGSQVTELSPFMNGRHYLLNDSAKTIVSAQPGFEKTAEATSDSTPFMAFMRDASIGYDYQGRRLICFNRNELYQYVYKLDTQTWHKIAHQLLVTAPLNSFPECLVLGKKESTKAAWKLISNNSEEDVEFLKEKVWEFLPDLDERELTSFFAKESMIDVSMMDADERADLVREMASWAVLTEITETPIYLTQVYDFSTTYIDVEERIPAKGIIATRPFDLDAPDLLKTITDVRVRGQFAKGAVKFILQGSLDGISFYTISTLRGKSWKMFRLILLADLDVHERISWVDVQYETRLTNRLR
jgi:hypothetical protein